MRLLPFAILGGLLLALPAAAAPLTSAFPTLAQSQAVAGYPDGSLHLERPIRRAEALKTIVRSDPVLAGSVLFFQTHLPSSPLFADIEQGSWYAPYVEVAAKQKIAMGYPDGTFRPAGALTVAEGLVLLHRAARIHRTVGFLSSPDLRNTPNQWYSVAVSSTIARNLPAEPLELGAVLTRGQFLTMLERLRTAERRRSFAHREYQPSTAAFPHLQRTSSTPSRTPITQVSRKPFALSLPSIGISDVTVTHPSDPFSDRGLLAPLTQGLGHLFSEPGKGGVVLIYGHSAGWPWDVSEFTRTFRRVNELEEGDRIYLTYRGTLYTYEVTHEEIVPASATSAFDPRDGAERIVLYTCWPPESTASRYLVHGTLVETVAMR